MKIQLNRRIPDLGTCLQTGYPRFSFSNAERVARQIRRNKRLALATYRCRHCGAWHLGTAGTRVNGVPGDCGRNLNEEQFLGQEAA